jgi:hypothetical protein
VRALVAETRGRTLEEIEADLGTAPDTDATPEIASA